MATTAHQDKILATIERLNASGGNIIVTLTIAI